MAFFDKIINQLFPPNEPKEPLRINEKYAMPATKLKAYELWNKTDQKAIFDKVFRGLQNEMISSGNDVRYSIHDQPGSRGFYFLCENLIDKEASLFAMEYLKDQLLQQKYYFVRGKKELFESGNSVKSRFQYYLKPKWGSYKPPLDQFFGNIHLEVMWIDDKPDYVKLMSNVYSDQNYKEPLSFELLLERLFND